MNEIQQDKIDYYSVGSREDIVISNSSLSWLDPNMGGSIKKFLSFFDKQEEKQESKSLENGSMLHLYIEKPDEFAISKIAKPDGMMGNMANEFYKLKNNLSSIEDLNNTSIAIISDLKTENGRSAETLAIKAAFEKLANLIDKPLEDTIRYFRLARTRTESYKSYKEETLISKFITDCIDYIKELDILQGKIPLTQSNKLIIENCINSLRENLLINKYFNLSGLFEDNLILKELDIYFELFGLKCKARLDNVYIDFDNKIIYLNDLKTTSKPISLFKNTLEQYRYYRQLAFYKKALIYSIKKQYPKLNDNITDEFKIVCQIIVVETIGNFESQIFNIDNYIEYIGNQELMSLLKRVKFHIDNNEWKNSMENIKGEGVIYLYPKILNENII